jgi:hypothetical protein
MPTGIGIGKKLPVAGKKKNAIEKSHRRCHKGNVGNQPLGQRGNPLRVACHWPPDSKIYQRLLSGGADAGKIARDAGVEARDTLGQLVDRGDQCQTDSGDNQRVLDQILAVFFSQKIHHYVLHCFDSGVVGVEAVFAAVCEAV